MSQRRVLSFDRVVLDGRTMSVEEFLLLPLAMRVSSILDKRASFFLGSKRIDLSIALQEIRRARADEPGASCADGSLEAITPLETPRAKLGPVGIGAMKGAAIVSTLNWVRAELGQDVVRQVLAAMPEDSAQVYASALPISWVPIAAEDAFMRALAATAWPGDRAKTIRQMRRLGEYVAAENLSTIYKMVLALTSPDRLLGLIPRLWSTYFKGVELTDMAKEPRAASYTVRHIGYFMLGAHATGWLEFAYRHVGSREPEIQCAELEQGIDDAPDLHFTMRW